MTTQSVMPAYNYPGVRIISLGVYLPKEVVSNTQLAKEMHGLINAAEKKLGRRLTDAEKKSLSTSDKWIQKRTGIKTRRRASATEATSDLGTAALLDALKKYGLPVHSLGFIIVCRVTPDYQYSPATSSIIQHKVGFEPLPREKESQKIADNVELKGIFTVDVELACTSFMAGLRLGHSLIMSGQYKYGAIIAADKMSTTVNPHDRSFSPILGDAGACLIIGACDPKDSSFIKGKDAPDDSYFFMGSHGEFAKDIICRAGGSREPVTHEMLSNPLIQPHKLWQDGKAVFKNIINLVYRKEHEQHTIIGQALKRSNIKLSSLKFVALHQANRRIIRYVGSNMRAGGFKGRNIINIHEYGNTTSPALLLCVYTAIQKGWLKPDDTILLCAFGGGYSWGTTVIKWNLPLENFAPEEILDDDILTRYKIK